MLYCFTRRGIILAQCPSRPHTQEMKACPFQSELIYLVIHFLLQYLFMYTQKMAIKEIPYLKHSLNQCAWGWRERGKTEGLSDTCEYIRHPDEKCTAQLS